MAAAGLGLVGGAGVRDANEPQPWSLGGVRMQMSSNRAHGIQMVCIYANKARVPEARVGVAMLTTGRASLIRLFIHRKAWSP